MLCKTFDAFLGRKARVDRQPARHRRFAMEPLEMRTVLSATIHVDTFDDVVDDDDGQTSLREANAAAVISEHADLILLPEGFYALTEGELEIHNAKGKLTIQSDGAVVDAQGNGRVFSISGGSDVELKGLTITGGDSRDDVEDSTFGGGIRNAASKLSVKNSHVSGNIAPEGGGIFNTEGAELMVVNSRIANNQALDDSGDFGNGGGISNVNSEMTLINSKVVGNSARRLKGNGNGGFGGGIITVGQNGHYALTLINTMVSGNFVTGGGGGIAVFSIATSEENTAGGTVTLTNSAVRDNSARSEAGVGAAEGGGIWSLGLNRGQNKITLTKSQVVGNHADSDGGGIYNLGIAGGQSTVMLNKSRVSRNISGSDGGGIYNGGLFGGQGTVMLHKTHVMSNRAAGDGGGVWNAGMLDLDRHSKIRHNTADGEGDNVFV